MSNREERIADRHLDKITINYFDKLVQITCDEALKNYLEEPGNGAVELMYISDKLTILHGQSDHLSRRFRSLISERYGR